MFIDDTGLMLRPLIGKTWVPRGEPPILHASARHNRLSAVGAVTLSPKSKRTGLYWTFCDDNIRTPQFLSCLRWLHRTLKTKLVVVMDPLDVHRSAARVLRESGAR